MADLELLLQTCFVGQPLMLNGTINVSLPNSCSMVRPIMLYQGFIEPLGLFAGTKSECEKYYNEHVDMLDSQMNEKEQEGVSSQSVVEAVKQSSAESSSQDVTQNSSTQHLCTLRNDFFDCCVLKAFKGEGGPFDTFVYLQDQRRSVRHVSNRSYLSEGLAFWLSVSEVTKEVQGS